MSDRAARIVFFDIGNTLGSVRLSPGRDRLERLDVYPYVPGVLEQLREHVRLGILSDRGGVSEDNVNAVLEAAGLYDYFDPQIILYGRKDSPDLFRRAAAKAGCAPSECLFVGEDAGERSQAQVAGFRVAPHPCLAWEALNDARLIYVRVTVPPAFEGEEWRAALRRPGFVPLHRTGENGRNVYAITTPGIAAQVDDLGFEVIRLGREDEPLTTDVYLLRDDRQVRTGFLNPQGNSNRFFAAAEEARWVLASAQQGLYVALPAGRSVEQYHFANALHGHNQKLLPDMSLLQPFGTGPNTRAASWIGLPAAEPELDDEERQVLSRITPEVMRSHMARLSGQTAVEGRLIDSRHIRHQGNAWATESLLWDLETIGAGEFVVSAHRFTHEGLTLDNVEAELRGSEGQEMVLVTAHLDSTAAGSPPYDPASDPAPGTDDDASGVAAVLAIAEVFRALSATRRPRRTIRFVLFNAEEHGLIGSRAYARDQAALEAPIIAVYQMDMIAYNVQSPATFEIHAGFWPSREVQDRSVVLAERISRLAQTVSPDLPSPQIYVSRGPAPRDRDPAEGRSDHASFQLVGYAGCCASEDFFAGPHLDSPESEPNPNYHQGSDVEFDAEYAAGIARAVAAAAWTTANL